MNNSDVQELPFMLFADDSGTVFEHPYYRMSGFSGATPIILNVNDLIPLSTFAKLFYLPGCHPIGLDPENGEIKCVPKAEINGELSDCYAVAAFLEPGFVRTYLPAAEYKDKKYVLPMWAYTAAGYKDNQWWAAGFQIEYSNRWDPNNYDDRSLIPAISAYKAEHTTGPLVGQLAHCATTNHCFAAKNLFLKRWEAPIPVSRRCNAACLGCLSLQSNDGCEASHQRMTFTPSRDEVVSLAVAHLRHAPEAIVSFGQGCEGEPLTETELICDCIKEIRKKTDAGTINLNTNGSRPERIRQLALSGLDSIRISMNSAQPVLYHAYYRPNGYRFKDVVDAIILSKKMKLYTMLNYLIFPGITDQEDEIQALKALIGKTNVQFVHFKNLNIDPHMYLDQMPVSASKGIGIKKAIDGMIRDFPEVEFGYFNRPVK